MPNHAKLNTVREHASAVEYDLGRPLAQNTSHVQNPLRLVDDTPQLHDASGTITTMRAWNPKGSGNGIQYQDTKSLYESPFGGSFATSTIYPDSSDTTSSSNLIANPDKLTDWTLDSQGNWVDSLSVNSPTGGDATTDGNVNFYDLTTLGANYGSSDNVRWREGDFDGDGSVNFFDQTTLSANYGASGGNVGTLQTRTNNAANEITSVSGSWVTPTYDAAGNMVSAPKAGAETTRLWYVYDAWNRQVIVKNDSSGSPGSTLATYSYDGLNRRVTKDIAGGDTFDDYFNENWQRLESRKNADTDPLDQFLWDQTYIDTPVLRWHDANTDGDLADLSTGDPDPTKDNTLYYTTDANHNITALYDADQERVIERYVYDPYGKTFVYDRIWGAISESAVDNDIQWSGYVSDKETGNKLARWRPYNVPLATWFARDFETYVDGMNLYQYVVSSPISNNDPSGLGPLDQAWSISNQPIPSKMSCHGNIMPPVDRLATLERYLRQLEDAKDWDYFKNPTPRGGPDSPWLWQEIQRVKKKMLVENKNYLFAKWLNEHPGAVYGNPKTAGGGPVAYDPNKKLNGWDEKEFTLKMPAWSRWRYVIQRGVINKGFTDTDLKEVMTDDWTQMNKLRDYYNGNGGTKWVGQNSREYWIRGRPADRADAATRVGNVGVEATNRLTVILDELLNGLNKVTVKTWVCGSQAFYEVQGVSHDTGRKITEDWVSKR